jgi:hypothetical protein
MVRKACEKYFNDTIQKKAEEALSSWLSKDETIEQMLERRIRSYTTRLVTDNIDQKAKEIVSDAIKKAIENAPKIEVTLNNG